jgi:hypothetical protein
MTRKKRSYTVSIDTAVLDLVLKIAAADRRSGTNVIEVAVLHYAKQPQVRALLAGNQEVAP